MSKQSIPMQATVDGVEQFSCDPSTHLKRKKLAKSSENLRDDKKRNKQIKE